MEQAAGLRAVGVRNSDNSWFGAIETAGSSGYVWTCLHNHRTLGEARACAQARVDRHIENLSSSSSHWTFSGHVQG